MQLLKLSAGLLLGAITLASFAAGNIDQQRAESADTDQNNWLLHGRDYAEQRHSPLTQINADSIDDLALVWSFDDITNRALEATPIVVDGVMYLSGTWSMVYALDAKSGELLWQYDPKVPKEMAIKACCDVVNRGVAVWDGKVYIGSLDGRLIAIDAATGEERWQTVTVDQGKPYTITGAPRVVKGKVLIGNGGAEYGVRGYITAYDADSGKQAWRFYTVPGNPELGFENAAMAMAAETWNGEWWQLGGGGTAWDHMAYDAELDLVYIGVGNGSPWNRRLRSPGGGDNLFLSSIVAVRPDSGEYVWHYQVVPAESWDYTATQHMVLADIEWQGEERKVLMQAPKSGFFMIIDRITGEYLSAEPFAEVTWASHYDDNGRPVENPGQDYAEGSAAVKPSSGGAHNWQPMAYNPEHRLMYIPKMEATFVYSNPKSFTPRPGQRNQGIDRDDAPPGDELLHREISKRIASGHLLAWDVEKQQAAWQIDLPTPWNGGVLSTAGNIVFQGNGDRRLVAYDATTGNTLWQAETQSPILAAPISYQIDGEQYITVAAGGGGAFGLMSGVKPPQGPKKSRFLTYKLGGQHQLPPIAKAESIPVPPPRTDASAGQLKRGSVLFSNNCSYCHGVGAISGGSLPDLRRMQPSTHQFFEQIVHGGAFATMGMPRFGEQLSKEEVNDIHAYLIDKANQDHELRNNHPWIVAIKQWFYSLFAWAIATFLGASSSSA
ncbi:Quinohemoprotein alcohol dehydrogenase ADH IIB [Sinobacterium norvegicum]|uniref:Quinohemoprotein alcohol dehydrogenase ADH IIB n=1 Tax=Sinobacterium norvegicum TaxID=1641715 RepID=A0ABM9AAI0_9GAMM|nr:PQQ-dependent dehydrogenase, methanol/ethanol family [Sinobacterium norvegicum]CAH0990011.1 Quinohemoprotein alcohol dehydrogenase ADH IIB [Sinobacterium norvegicum]